MGRVWCSTAVQVCGAPTSAPRQLEQQPADQPLVLYVVTEGGAAHRQSGAGRALLLRQGGWPLCSAKGTCCQMWPTVSRSTQLRHSSLSPSSAWPSSPACAL